MKIFLENKKRFSGTGLSYPFLELGEPFHVYLKHCSCCNTFIVGYAINNKLFREEEEKKIKEICKSGKIKHKISPSHLLHKELILYDLPEKRDTFHLLTKIDEILGLPIEKLDETKLPLFF